MIKRTSIFFIILANILLFAIVAIPHHHHSYKVCFKHSHCLNEDKEGTKHDHRHDGKSDCCALVFNILPSIEENIYSPDTPSFGFDLQECLFENAIELLNQAPKPDNPPWIKSPQSLYINSSAGLRAPPAV